MLRKIEYVGCLLYTIENFEKIGGDPATETVFEDFLGCNEKYFFTVETDKSFNE